MKYYIRTYGCQMNYNDSERIRSIFNFYNLEETEDPKDADYVVLNSCAVRKSAEEKLLGFGKQLNQYKLERKDGYPYVFMTGCIIKTGIRGRVRSKAVEKSHSRWQSLDWIDSVAPTKYVFGKIVSTLNNDPNIIRQYEIQDVQSYLDITPVAYSRITASVPISVGCNHHCTFCTVPFSRGQEEFREFSRIESEYRKYVQGGYKQITLLGQTVNKWLNPKFEYKPSAYGWYKVGSPTPLSISSEIDEPDSFLTLLKNLDSIEGDYWLNFVSSYPNYFNDELINYLLESINSPKGHIVPQIHLAVQSGSNRLLEQMARHHTVEDFMSIIRKLRSKLPELSITTDVIVGFSGESEQDFLQTVKLVEESDFDMIYISEYSVRPDTPAETIEDDIPKEEKKRRKEYLNLILENGLKNRNQIFKDKECTVLATSRKHGNLLGKNEYGKDVEIEIPDKVENPENLIGKFVKIKILSINPWNLKGQLI
jgi:tRNA-2-methylthio-N6-dimethylallyladenosine synthase